MKLALRELRLSYESEGFVLLGVFGSYARGDETPASDVDLLFETTADFSRRYPGLRMFGRLDEIRREMAARIGKNVDLVDRAGLGRVGQKYILPEVKHVA